MPQRVIDARALWGYYTAMNEDEIKKEQGQEDIPADETAQSPDEAAQQQSPAEETPEQPVDELIKWRETALRTAAEYDNYRKRCTKERAEFAKYANQGLLEELLPVIDNFEMGMQMAGQDTSSMIYVGMSMVQKQLHAFLEGQGVQAIPCEPGQMFDHNLHEAIMSEPSDRPEGTILRILRRGFRLKDRLLRPVNVVTAAAPEQQNAEDKA